MDYDCVISARSRDETLRNRQDRIADKVAKVILNRPDKKNVMNPQLHRDMT
jgi:enoyl-CoA hydratase/carnithine racemase